MTESEFQEQVQRGIDAAVTQGTKPAPYKPLRRPVDRAYAVLTGEARDFWAPNTRLGYDNEQQLPIFAAVHRATSMPGATDAQRWKIVEAEIIELAQQYAEYTDE